MSGFFEGWNPTAWTFIGITEGAALGMYVHRILIKPDRTGEDVLRALSISATIIGLTIVVANSFSEQ